MVFIPDKEAYERQSVHVSPSQKCVSLPLASSRSKSNKSIFSGEDLKKSKSNTSLTPAEYGLVLLRIPVVDIVSSPFTYQCLNSPCGLDAFQGKYCILNSVISASMPNIMLCIKEMLKQKSYDVKFGNLY